MSVFTGQAIDHLPDVADRIVVHGLAFADMPSLNNPPKMTRPGAPSVPAVMPDPGLVAIRAYRLRRRRNLFCDLFCDGR
ncbi:hypothetical protein ACI2LC_40565 [Nonomuraea wenchangensis]|uniref:hypothetical protein n=1 Tax=Nonomuraea wenchangensis TaxID=568860 RepID=UPI0038507275